jgi:glycosyltransferase involved in cell wall biosynthesis
VNVALCSSGDLFGGVETFVVSLATALNAGSGHTAIAVLFSHGPLRERLLEEGIEVEVFAHHRYDPTVVCRVAQFFRARNIEVAHTHGYKATLLCGAAARLSGARIVKTEHGALEPFGMLDRIKMSINVGIDRWLAPLLVDRIVYVSDDIRQRNGRYFRSVPGEVIYNGIRRSRAIGRDRPPELEPPQFTLGVVGRLTSVKGHIYLLRALTELRHLDLRLCVLGDGELRADLEAFAETHRLNVIFLGFRRDPNEYVRALDAIVMPSLHEGFPYAMLEAAYWGVPLIASRVGGMQEVLEDRRDCLLVDARDVGQLRDAIACVYHSPELRRTMAENARRKVMARFLVDSMVARYVTTYERALNGRVH